MNSRVRHLCFACVLLCSVPLCVSAQLNTLLHFFPDSTYIHTVSADQYAHQMKIENILISKNIVSSMGGVFPVFNFDLPGTTVQASLGTSVHFEVRPQGQAHVVSTDFYIDYLILDVPLRHDFFYRFVTGHTSHHLSDNWYEKLNYTHAIHYSRDYIQSFLMYSHPDICLASLGADYAYVFHLAGKESKRWKIDLSLERMWGHLSESIVLFSSINVKLHQEAGFASSNAYQLGIEMPMQYGKRLRIAYQLRHGLDERGQFFPNHIFRQTIGLYIET